MTATTATYTPQANDISAIISVVVIYASGQGENLPGIEITDPTLFTILS